MTLTINAFFGWDFNSCESLAKGGVWYPIDFANACPDSQVTSLHYHFPWLIKANLRWSIFCAATDRKMRKNLDWEPFYAIADRDLAPRERLREYAADRPPALRDREVPRLLPQAPRASRRARLRVLRLRDDARRGAPEGDGAVPARTRSTSSPSCSSAGCSAGASRRGRAATKTASRWYSERLEQEIGLVRWGHWGQPVLIFPTAGGDAEEIERMHLIGALGPLIDAGRIKVYSCDNLAGRAFAAKAGLGRLSLRAAQPLRGVRRARGGAGDPHRLPRRRRRGRSPPAPRSAPSWRWR